MNFSFIHFCSLDFEECAHKLLKMQIKDEQLVSGSDVMDFIWSTFNIKLIVHGLNSIIMQHVTVQQIGNTNYMYVHTIPLYKSPLPTPSSTPMDFGLS